MSKHNFYLSKNRELTAIDSNSNENINLLQNDRNLPKCLKHLTLSILLVKLPEMMTGCV